MTLITSQATWIVAAVAAMVAVAPEPARAQVPQEEVVDSRPAVSVGIGLASTGSDSGGSTTALVVGARALLTPHLAAEVEWTSRESHLFFFDSGPSHLATLNGQVGQYGQYTTRVEQGTRWLAGVNILGRATIGRVSPFAGLGVAAIRSAEHQTNTWIGCTGPWVAHCDTGNFNYSRNDLLISPQWLGGLDADLTRRIQIYGSGRMSYNSDHGYRSSLLAGVRVTVLPDRRAPKRIGDERAPRVASGAIPGVRTGQKVWVTTADGIERAGTLLAISPVALTMSVGSNEVTVPLPSVRYVERPDPVHDGAGWGVLVGAVFGGILAGYTHPRALPAGILIAGGAGAFLDSLGNDRQLVYSAALPAITVAPVLAPGHAAVGVRMSWR